MQYFAANTIKYKYKDWILLVSTCFAHYEIYTWTLCHSYLHEKQTSRIQSLNQWRRHIAMYLLLYTCLLQWLKSQVATTVVVIVIFPMTSKANAIRHHSAASRRKMPNISPRLSAFTVCFALVFFFFCILFCTNRVTILY